MRKISCFLHLALIFLLLSLVHEAAASIAKPGCLEKCGNLTVPYPFGIGKGCFLNENFEVSCNASSHSANLSLFKSEVYKIGKDYVEVLDAAIPFYYNKSSGQSLSDGPPGCGYSGDYYSISRTRNKFIAIGCDIFAYITNEKTKEFVTGCAALCTSNISSRINSSSCSGNRCCQATIPQDLTDYLFWVYAMNTEAKSWASGQCSLSMIVEKDFTDFNKFDLSGCNDSFGIPLVLDWAIGNISCREAVKSKNYTCGQHSKCVDSTRGLGYLCTCLPGYQGNPYY